MRDRRCILHIGICKTGTTSIQSALTLHKGALSQCGVFVPRTFGATNNHRHLILLAMDDSSEAGRHEWEVMRYRNPELGVCGSMTNGRKWVERELAAELDDAPEDSWVIFSSEQLSQRLLHDDEVWQLRESLEALGFTQFRIVAYVREQIGLSLSWESMEVLSGKRSTRLKKPEAQFNHQHMLERWERVWGRDALLVRTYARSCLEDSDVVCDFSRHVLPIGADFTSLGEMQWRNGRLGQRSLWALRAANRWLPRFLPREAANHWRNKLVQTAQTQWLSGKPAQARPAQIAIWRKYYTTSNQWVDCHYGTQLEGTFGKT